MCILPDGEFIAPFDIAAIKVVTGLRYSEIAPIFRIPEHGYFAGAVLHYPCSEWVVSPSGPGIHCYHLKPGGPFPFSASDTTIRLTIPKGARVLWETMEIPGQNNVLILAASEVLVLT